MGRAILLSEISGSIWNINCKVGDVVESGQDVIVIESMKMEIPVVSTVTGTVVSIFCLLYTSPSPRDSDQSRMPSSA